MRPFLDSIIKILKDHIIFFIWFDWLILTACQPFWGYFIPRSLGIASIERLYLHFFCIFFYESFFCT